MKRPDGQHRAGRVHLGDLDDALNKLAKWRTVFAGWQLGTRTKDDPESQAVRDHREVTILMRVELSTLANVLIDKGVITHEEYTEQLMTEAQSLDKAYETKFPGFKSSMAGMEMSMPEVGETMKGWPP